jgi:hypothetical protein
VVETSQVLEQTPPTHAWPIGQLDGPVQQVAHWPLGQHAPLHAANALQLLEQVEFRQASPIGQSLGP